MPVKSAWYNEEKTILLIKYDGNWTIDDYYDNFKIANGLIKSVEHQVVSILDFSTSGPIPIQFITVGKHAAKHKASNSIRVIAFGVNRYMEMMGGLFRSLFPNTTQGLRLVSTMQEALDIAQATLGKQVT